MIRFAVMIAILATLGCGNLIRKVPDSNIIMVDADGHPVDPRGYGPCERDPEGNCNKRHSIVRSYPQFETPGAYGDHVMKVLEGLEKHKSAGKPHKILIHVHGGLNFQTGTVERATELSQDILTETDAYPLFINWQSSLFPSYWNHLTHIRQGEDWSEGAWSQGWAYATAPFYLAADFARSAIRVPTATFFQVRNDIETVPPLRFLHSSDLLLAQQTIFDELCERRLKPTVWVEGALYEYMKALDKEIKDCPIIEAPGKGELSGFNIWLGLDQRNWSDKFVASLKYMITSPTKLASAPIIDAFGTSSWDVMLRSVGQLFHYDGSHLPHINENKEHKSRDVEYDPTRTGALSVFLEQLRTKVCNYEKQTLNIHSSHRVGCPNKDRWEITLVGHSTGAIIVNRIIREFGDLPIKNVVYMAAASSIKDYQDTIFPYLLKRNEGIAPNEATKLCNATSESLTLSSDSRNAVCVYHLMLHEAAESGEWFNDILDPFPRGSLLVWLDNFLSHPLSREDRVLGRFTNFIAAAHHTPSVIRPYINIVKYGVGEGVLSPQKHGDFGGKLKFWIQKCWAGPPDHPRDCYRELGHY